VTALLAALALAALPQGSVRYRVTLAGEPVGVAALEIRCAAGACRAVYQVELRGPAEAGGALSSRRVEVEVDRAGRYRGGRLRAVADGAERARSGPAGRVPSALAEVVLAAAARAGEACADGFEEEGGRAIRACARPDGPVLRAEVDGTRETIWPGRDGFPAEVLVEDRLRFVRDPAARVPERAPRLSGSRVEGPVDARAARSFCGVPRDPPAGALPRGLPPPRASGASCREKTAAWLAAAARAGALGRTAVGVAFDGLGFVWHAWAEVRTSSGWVPVDPSFGEAPARGPRFTLGRYAEGDGAGRAAAGRKVLACWGAARVE